MRFDLSALINLVGQKAPGFSMTDRPRPTEPQLVESPVWDSGDNNEVKDTRAIARQWSLYRDYSRKGFGHSDFDWQDPQTAYLMRLFLTGRINGLLPSPLYQPEQVLLVKTEDGYSGEIAVRSSAKLELLQAWPGIEVSISHPCAIPGWVTNQLQIECLRGVGFNEYIYPYRLRLSRMEYAAYSELAPETVTFYGPLEYL